MPILIPNGTEIPQWLEQKIGARSWTAFQDNTKKGLLTAITCYQSFDSITNEVDYASSIIPIMKSLEYELRLQFYDPYVDYLQSHYTTEGYADIILQNTDNAVPGDYQKAAALKKSILSYDKYSNVLTYVDTRAEKYFTLGRFVHSISDGKPFAPTLDRPIVDYCQHVLFPDSNVSNNKIRKWLKDIIIGVLQQQRTRDDSAHGRKIQNRRDAEKAIEDTISVGRLLAKIKTPDFI